jgi:nitrite reductase/ring-hydroxylating ferredoxin subunit
MGDPGDKWLNLIEASALEKGDVTAVDIKDYKLAVYDTFDGIFVTDARCTHAGANLCDGYFDGHHIECPLHQGLFDCKTGEAKAAPVVKALKVYEARVADGLVQIKLA